MTERRAQDSEGLGLVTLADVAVLARVKRPAVTMWRKRPHAVAGAFPQPVARIDGVERFERTAVVDWLVASGRGNNPDLALDAALHTRPPLPTPEGWALTTALLAVRALAGEALSDLDRDDVLDLAEEVDPDDRFAFTEIAVAQERHLAATAVYVDGLAGAAFGGEDALRHLDRDPSRFGLSPDGTVVAADVLDVVGALAHALATSTASTTAGGQAPIVDPTGCGSSLLMAALRASGAEAWGRSAARPVVGCDTESVRWGLRDSWRRLALHGVFPEAVDTDEDGHVEITGEAVVVAGYPHPGAPAMTPEALLDAVDDVLVQLDPRQPAVVVGPASVLTDAVGGAADRTRHGMLTSGRLRALVRFGPGSSVAVPQRRLAMWVIGPVPAGNPRQGRTAVVDVAGLDLAEVRDDLVADIVAAIEDRPVPGAEGDEGQARAHVFRVARYVPTFRVLSGRGDLVPRDLGIRSPQVRSVDAVGTVSLAARVEEPVAGVPVEVQASIPAGVATAGTMTTIRELLDLRRVRIIPGTRLSDGEVHDSAALAGSGVPVPVLGPTELGGGAPIGGRVVDLIAFTAAHPRAQRTEAGDVVFSAGTSHRPAAWVDARGGTVVEYPARALRVVDLDGEAREGQARTDRVIPHVLAADLARGEGAEWRSFPARLVPVVSADTLSEVLDSIAVARADAQRRADELNRLTQLLADGAVAGQVTAMMKTNHAEGHERATS